MRPCFLTGLALLGMTAACQTAPQPNADFLSSYDALTTREDTLRASIRERRDEAVAGSIESVWLDPAVFVGEAGANLTDVERSQVLREVDRQVCYEISERFSISQTSADGSARVRVGVVRVTPNSGVAGGVSAVASAFIPGPGSFRVPGTTGGLAAEAELLDAAGRQGAALAWARNANVVGTDSPSLSRLGDALQMAEPFGDAVADAFAPTGRAVRPIPIPDPCAAYGPRTQPAGFAARVITGLYVPEVNTGSSPERSVKP